MSKFKIHDLESAPEESKPILEASIKGFGMLPNLHGVMAESPTVLKAYKLLHQFFSKETAFDAEELTVIWQTINVENNCHYCVPAHTGIAHMMKVNPEITEALRNRASMPTAKLQALHETTLLIVRNQGQLTAEEMDTFFAAGYGTRHVLEIFLGLAQKTISNYTNHVAKTPVDAPFTKFAWETSV